MKKLIAIAAMVILGLVQNGCKNGTEHGPAELQRPPVSGVEVTEVTLSRLPEYYESSATIRAKSTSVISGRLMGAITSLLVKEGDPVKTGQLLLTIDDRDMAQKVAAAEAAFREAESGLAAARQNMELSDITYQRYKKLFEGKALSRQELDQIETRKRVAELDYQRAQDMVKRAAAGRAEARVYLKDAQVTSPVDGVVVSRHIDVGSMAGPGMPLLTVADTSAYEIHAALAERLTGILTKGVEVNIYLPASDRWTTGKIIEIVPAVDQASRTFQIKIGLIGTDFQPGLYAKLRIPVGERQALLLPADALVEKGHLIGVYVVNADKIITYRLVRPGKHYKEKVEILSGLKENDRVVTGGVGSAVDGGILQESREGSPQ